MDDQGKKRVIRQLPGLGIGGGGLRGVDILKAKYQEVHRKCGSTRARVHTSQQEVSDFVCGSPK